MDGNTGGWVDEKMDGLMGGWMGERWKDGKKGEWIKR